MTISPKQMRAARALLDLNIADVAKPAGMADATLSKAESGKTSMNPENNRTLEAYYVSLGLEFTENNGVREAISGVHVYKGNEGFRAFYDELYETAKTKGGDICLLNGVSSLVAGALGAEYVEIQKSRMGKISNNFTYRVIVEEGDNTFFGSGYCKYRWIQKQEFGDTAIFTFGSKTAFAVFEGGEVEVTVYDRQGIANIHRSLFNTFWDKATVPNNE